LPERALVIIPTYNERENIRRLIDSVLAQDARIDVLVVDDGSPDGTGALVDEIVSSNDRVHVQHRARKLGLGTAYIVGFRWALERDYAYVLEMDADFSHDPIHLPQFLQAVEGADMVAEHAREVRQQLVADRVPEVVVDPLQVVHVEHDDRAERGLGELEADPLRVRAAIQAAGERVIERHSPEAVVRDRQLGAGIVDLAAAPLKLYHDHPEAEHHLHQEVDVVVVPGEDPPERDGRRRVGHRHPPRDQVQDPEHGQRGEHAARDLGTGARPRRRE